MLPAAKDEALTKPGPGGISYPRQVVSRTSMRSVPVTGHSDRDAISLRRSRKGKNLHSYKQHRTPTLPGQRRFIHSYRG